jgi:hypothetical protein
MQIDSPFGLYKEATISTLAVIIFHFRIGYAHVMHDSPG